MCQPNPGSIRCTADEVATKPAKSWPNPATSSQSPCDEDPAAAEVSLDPVRARLLAELAEPGSATMLAAKMGLARQKVNYHLRALEKHGLVALVEERRKGNVTEGAAHAGRPRADRGRR